MFSSSNTTETKNKDNQGRVAPNMQDQNGTDGYAQSRSEGTVARAIESQTARLPSDLFLWAAMGSIVLSLSFQLSGRKSDSNFVGHWAPTFLTLGLYNKLVKVAGHDRATR